MTKEILFGYTLGEVIVIASLIVALVVSIITGKDK